MPDHHRLAQLLHDADALGEMRERLDCATKELREAVLWHRLLTKLRAGRARPAARWSLPALNTYYRQLTGRRE